MFGQTAAFATLAGVAGIGTVAALVLWPVKDPHAIAHRHDDLPPDHPHVREAHGAGVTAHDFVIDDYHAQWPRSTN